MLDLFPEKLLKIKKKKVVLHNGKESENKFHAKTYPPSKFSWKFVQKFVCNPADKPINQPTTRHTGETITSLAEVIM